MKEGEPIRDEAIYPDYARHLTTVETVEQFWGFFGEVVTDLANRTFDVDADDPDEAEPEKT